LPADEIRQRYEAIRTEAGAGVTVVAATKYVSLEDMKVQVHTYDAEMGRTGGGVFNTALTFVVQDGRINADG
jgi:hypothetical protein